MRFKVPQFLEIEDKIFGPFTFKEFVYLVGGIGLCFVIYRLLGFVLGAIPIILVASFSLALMFYRPNNKPFVNMLESVFKFSFQSKLYIWKRRKAKKQKVSSGEGTTYELKETPALNTSKLRDLAWSLDVIDASRQKEKNLSSKEN